jgi:predicted nucleic acid-binding protein
MPDVFFVALAVRLNSHLIDEDLSLHPSEQKSLAGDPESMGTPVKSCPDTEQIDEIRYSVQAV